MIAVLSEQISRHGSNSLNQSMKVRKSKRPATQLQASWIPGPFKSKGSEAIPPHIFFYIFWHVSIFSFCAVVWSQSRFIYHVNHHQSHSVIFTFKLVFCTESPAEAHRWIYHILLRSFCIFKIIVNTLAVSFNDWKPSINYHILWVTHSHRAFIPVLGKDVTQYMVPNLNNLMGLMSNGRADDKTNEPIKISIPLISPMSAWLDTELALEKPICIAKTAPNIGLVKNENQNALGKRQAWIFVHNFLRIYMIHLEKSYIYSKWNKGRRYWEMCCRVVLMLIGYAPKMYDNS